VGKAGLAPQVEAVIRGVPIVSQERTAPGVRRRARSEEQRYRSWSKRRAGRRSGPKRSAWPGPVCQLQDATGRARCAGGAGRPGWGDCSVRWSTLGRCRSSMPAPRVKTTAKTENALFCRQTSMPEVRAGWIAVCSQTYNGFAGVRVISKTEGAEDVARREGREPHGVPEQK
jgi:hypothetical protein